MLFHLFCLTAEISFSRENSIFFVFVMKQCGAEAGKKRLKQESKLVGNCGSLARTLLRVLRERKQGRE
jgi:hypothetical protein